MELSLSRELVLLPFKIVDNDDGDPRFYRKTKLTTAITTSNLISKAIGDLLLHM